MESISWPRKKATRILSPHDYFNPMIKKLLTLFILTMALFAQKPKDTTTLPVTFMIRAGVDHFNSQGTYGIFSAGIALDYPSKIAAFTELTADNSLSWLLGAKYPFTPWFELTGAYGLKRYSLYQTNEHNLFLSSYFHHKKRPIVVGGILGWDFRWVKFGEDTPYYTSLPIWEITLLTTPVERWELNLVLSNRHNQFPISSGYLEIALTNKVHLIDNLSLLADIGIAPSGFFSVAGYIDRFFTTVGVTYEF